VQPTLGDVGQSREEDDFRSVVPVGLEHELVLSSHRDLLSGWPLSGSVRRGIVAMIVNLGIISVNYPPGGEFSMAIAGEF
jgi:hypothetical protein